MPLSTEFRNIEKDTIRNNYYRKVVYTTANMQLVLMSLEPNEDIPLEVHEKSTQFIRVESGTGVCQIGRRKYGLKDGSSIIIPHGKVHYVGNTSKTKPLKLYAIYTPPEHPKNKKQKRQPRQKR